MRVILATDGSDASLRAARILHRTPCPAEGDEVFAIYVFPLPSDPELYRHVVSLPSRVDDERVQGVARPILEATKKELEGLACRIYDAVLLGDPTKEIVSFATSMKADLLVVGTHGRSLRKELALGSVSNSLTHLAPCSVLLVR